MVASIGFTRIDSHQRFNQVPRRAVQKAELQKEWEELLDPVVVSLFFSKTSEKQRHKRIFFLSCYKEYMNTIDVVFCFGDEDSMVKSTEKEFFWSEKAGCKRVKDGSFLG